MKFRFLGALFASFILASAAQAQTGKFPGLKIPGTVPSDDQALRDNGTGLKLLRTVFKNRPDDINTMFAPPATAPLEVALVNVPNSAISLKCPKDKRCIIEVTIQLSSVIPFNGNSAAAAVKIDNNALPVAGGVAAPIDNYVTFMNWTYVKTVNAGTHTVQPMLAYTGEHQLWGYSIVARLYRR